MNKSIIDLVKFNAIVIGANWCPYCMRAKDLVKEKYPNYKFIDVDQFQEARQELKTKYNWQTIPGIFIEGKFIGGFTDLQKKWAKSKSSL